MCHLYILTKGIAMIVHVCNLFDCAVMYMVVCIVFICHVCSWMCVYACIERTALLNVEA